MRDGVKDSFNKTLLRSNKFNFPLSLYSIANSKKNRAFKNKNYQSEQTFRLIR